MAKLIELDTKIDMLTDRIARLEKNSSNSSKPPSSDIVKPECTRAERRREAKKKRKRGGQEGHPKREREPFEPHEVTPIEYAQTDFLHVSLLPRAAG